MPGRLSMSFVYCLVLNEAQKIMFSLDISRSLGVVQAGFHYLIQGVPLGHYSQVVLTSGPLSGRTEQTVGANPRFQQNPVLSCGLFCTAVKWGWT